MAQHGSRHGWNRRSCVSPLGGVTFVQVACSKPWYGAAVWTPKEVGGLSTEGAEPGGRRAIHASLLGTVFRLSRALGMPCRRGGCPLDSSLGISAWRRRRQCLPTIAEGGAPHPFREPLARQEAGLKRRR